MTFSTVVWRSIPNSLEVSANLIPLLSQPVRVGGPGNDMDPRPATAYVLWMRRRVRIPRCRSFLASVEVRVADFISTGSDMTNSTYYHVWQESASDKYTFARNTRFGFENAFGVNPNTTNPVVSNPRFVLVSLLTTNASCNAVPLPERLYAGGASSHRGFPINGAGPRDLQTGFPVGGSAVSSSIPLNCRMPAPTLPYVGDNVSFVLFYDMGNVFQHALARVFPSFGRFSQPNKKTCNNVSGSIGTCDFNYFSHAVGLGARDTRRRLVPFVSISVTT